MFFTRQGLVVTGKGDVLNPPKRRKDITCKIPVSVCEGSNRFHLSYVLNEFVFPVK